ncbi:MAG: diphosphomevalonate decarboxylase [Flavobacteriaceae bacterium]|nr:MAG: diphosphomevalonate decarboxylase [Flavobacteriaceae bacterium]
MIETDFILNNFNVKNSANGSVTWKTPSNIALVKYWGKTAPQIPENTSISFTLDACFTLTTLQYEKREVTERSRRDNQGEVISTPLNHQNFNFEVFFEGEKKDDFKPKIEKFFERIEQYVPFLKDFNFVIKSRNSFPHSSGIASSASGMSALALCIMSLEKKIKPTISEEYFNKKASFLARLGSGSACRSIEGEVIVWGNHPKIEGSSDLFGVKFSYKVHSNFKNYHDTILLVDEDEKQVSSTVGHQLMHNHPFAKQRFKQANENILKISEVFQNGNLKEFIAIVESEALSLHAMMMTSNPYFILMKPNTLKIINKIWKYRGETSSNICFTLDAGANVHILFPENEKEKVNKFITSELIQYCQENHYICDRIGQGGKQLKMEN